MDRSRPTVSEARGRALDGHGESQSPASSAAPPDEAAPADLPEGVPYRLTADDYFRMVEADIIPPDRRVGLWRGRLYEKMAKKIPHSAGYKPAHRGPDGVPFRKVGASGSRTRSSSTTSQRLLPDFAIVRGTPNAYYQRGTVPKPEDIGLVVEVADSSLRKNLTETLQTYARAGLPCYWVVNLVARRVEVYSEPVDRGRDRALRGLGAVRGREGRSPGARRPRSRPNPGR